MAFKHFLPYIVKKYWLKVLKRRKQKYINNLVRNGLKLGNNVKIVDTFFFDPSHCFLISIGDNCTICPNVRLIAHDASTKKHLGYTKVGRIEIGDNCFIGDSVIILPAVTIGPNSIIGAGSVVTHNIPGDSVAAGNPSRLIMTTKDFLDKFSSGDKTKKIFNENYWIENIDDKKRNEIIESLGNEIGYIV